jgi:hypothetical protein
MTPSTSRAESAISESLRGPTISVADALAPGGLPHADGFYAWWASETVLPMAPVYPHPTEDLRLLYVGIAPGRDPARRRSGSRRSTLRSRIADQHICGNTGSSTLKLVLAALLLDERGYRPSRRAKKTLLESVENADLRSWQERNLRLSWQAWPRPWEGTIEADVIRAMNPPLNWQHNRLHPFWPDVDAARRRFQGRPPQPQGRRAGARPAR